MYILGISCFYHDSAVCLIRDGKIVFAAQEERFSRKKHDASFPKNALAACLHFAGIGLKDIEYAVFYEKPFIKFERILETYLAYSPTGIKSFLMAVPLWLKEKLWMSVYLQKELSGFEGKLIFPEHHESHAASCFFPSPFAEAAFLTADGVGEWATTSYGAGKGNEIKIIKQLDFPHSLGLLYSAFTYYTGFKVNSGEYKVMGLAPYGEPKYVKTIYDNLLDLKEDGSFRLNLDYFNYCAGLTMTNEKFNGLFGGPPRKPETNLSQREMDLAASIQVVTEEIMLRMARHIRKETGMRYLTLGGGVALNCVANGKLLREKIFDDIWIQPAAGDSGGALGAALFAWHQYLGNKREPEPDDSQSGSYLGTKYSNDDIGHFLTENRIPAKKLADEELFETATQYLAEGKVIGWFSGRMEFGPRALGARSIIGDARNSSMQKNMNLKIKFRESFRPFAPSVLEERVNEWFELETKSPYMLLVADVRKEKRRPLTESEEKLWGIDRLNIIRSEIPAVTHLDYSARIQTVSKKYNGRYYALLESFYKKTGCPVLVNTSFNVRGEPIVESPRDAYRCFMRTGIDFLVLENFILDKKEYELD